MKRWRHPQGDTGIPELSYRQHGKLTMARNRHPAVIYYPSVCKECVAFVKSDYRTPFRLICKWCSPNLANVCCLKTEKFALKVGYRETRPPFWDALISKYRRPMTNGVLCITNYSPPLYQLSYREWYTSVWFKGLLDIGLRPLIHAYAQTQL